MRETPAKYEFKIFVGGVAPTKISVRWGRPREIQRPCRALHVTRRLRCFTVKLVWFGINFIPQGTIELILRDDFEQVR